MRILIFCWRDIKNPKAGGAEILTHEVAIRWIKAGHQVSIISANFPGGKTEEIINGIQIYRPAVFNHYSPPEYFYYLLGTRAYYKVYFQGKVDIIIDQIHGLPSFSKFYVKEKLVAFPLEIAKKIWFYELPFPYNIAGFLLEIFYLRLYRSLPFITISPSTTKDLKGFGVKKVTTVHVGLSFKPCRVIPRKTKNPLIVSIGRITKMKRLELLIAAFKIIIHRFPHAEFVIAGNGPKEYLQQLKKLTKDYGIQKNISFLGYISEKEKIKLLKKAWILTSGSVHEGWGIIVIEANACGTPAVTFRVPGLVDSVKNNRTGIICQKSSPEEMAKRIEELIRNKTLRNRLSKNALKYSYQFSWDRTAKEIMKFLKNI